METSENTTKDIPAPREPLTADEIAKLWDEQRAGHIIWAHMIPQNLVSMVFMPLVFMKEDDLARLAEEDLIIYANTFEDQTMGRAINGYPMFASMRTLPRTDFDRLLKYGDKLDAAMEAAKVALDDI